MVAMLFAGLAFVLGVPVAVLVWYVLMSQFG